MCGEKPSACVRSVCKGSSFRGPRNTGPVGSSRCLRRLCGAVACGVRFVQRSSVQWSTRAVNTPRARDFWVDLDRDWRTTYIWPQGVSSFSFSASACGLAPYRSLRPYMFDHLTRLHKRYAEKSNLGIAISLLLHALALAAIVYANDTVRRAVVAREYRTDAAGGASGPMLIPGRAPPDSLLDTPEPPSAADVVLPGIRIPRVMLRAAGVPQLDLDLPDTLELGRPVTTRLSLPPNRLPVDSVLRVSYPNGTPMSPVSLSHARQATLHGERLIVQPESPPLQLTDTIRRTRWHWTVIPTEPGLQTVYLQLDAAALVEGKPRIVTLGRVRQDVLVQATPLQRLSRFFARNWTLLCLVTLFAIVAWGRARWAGR